MKGDFKYITVILVLIASIGVFVLALLFSKVNLSTQYLGEYVDISQSSYFKKDEYHRNLGYYLFDQDYYKVSLNKDKSGTKLTIKDFTFKVNNNQIIDKFINFKYQYFLIGLYNDDGTYLLYIYDINFNLINKLVGLDYVKLYDENVLFKKNEKEVYSISINDDYELVIDTLFLII